VGLGREIQPILHARYDSAIGCIGFDVNDDSQVSCCLQWMSRTVYKKVDSHSDSAKKQGQNLFVLMSSRGNVPLLVWEYNQVYLF